MEARMESVRSGDVIPKIQGVIGSSEDEPRFANHNDDMDTALLRRTKRRDGAMPPTHKGLILPATITSVLALICIILTIIPWHNTSKNPQTTLHLQIVTVATFVWLIILSFTPVLIHRSYSYPNANATSMGIQFFTSVTGFAIGIWGATTLSHFTIRSDPILWSFGLVAVLTAFLAPIAAIVILTRRALSAKQNPKLEEGWIISFIRCTWIPIRKRTCCCVMLPLFSLTIFVVTLALESYNTQHEAGDAHALDTFVLGTCILCGWWLLSSGVIFFREVRDGCTMATVVLNSLGAVAWATVGTIWLMQDSNEKHELPKLYGASVAAVLVLYIVGVFSGCCIGLCRVEKFFDDGIGVRRMDMGALVMTKDGKKDGGEDGEDDAKDDMYMDEENGLMGAKKRNSDAIDNIHERKYGTDSSEQQRHTQRTKSHATASLTTSSSLLLLITIISSCMDVTKASKIAMVNGNHYPSKSDTAETWRKSTYAMWRNDFQAAAAVGVDLIITPEFALSDRTWLKSCTRPTNAKSSWCPILNSNVTCNDTTAYSELACMAKEFKVSIAVNVCEGDENETNWNTQAIFGSNGTLITKYRKTHPYYPKCFQTPTHLELVTFNISTIPFEMGIFTCKDILYKTPAKNLYDMGIRHFIYSSAIPLVGNVVKKVWSDRYKDSYLMASDSSSGQSGVFHNGKKIVSETLRNASVVVWDIPATSATSTTSTTKTTKTTKTTATEEIKWSTKIQQQHYMRRAIVLAKEAMNMGAGGPYAALIVDPSNGGTIIAEGLNRASINPVLHGEIEAISNLSSSLKKNISVYDVAQNYELYTTAEPCPMCMGAIDWSGFGRVVYGTSIPFIKQQGHTQINLRATVVEEAGFHNITIIGGVLSNETNLLYIECGDKCGHHGHHHVQLKQFKREIRKVD